MASVQAALQPGDRHLVLETDQFNQARAEALALGSHVAFVDDDDHIAPSALRLVRAALERTDAACVFTDELLVDEAGTVLFRNEGPRTRFDLVVGPRRIHHLTVLRSNAVHSSCLALAERHGGIGFDWLSTASAACVSVVHVPAAVYSWVQHPGQMVRSVRHEEQHRHHHATLSRQIREWLQGQEFQPIEAVTIVTDW